MMEPTTLGKLLAEVPVTCEPGVLSLEIPASWIVPGENRLSYTTIIRLIECCREYHWRNDVTSGRGALDSIVLRCEASFRRVIPSGARVRIAYRVRRVMHKAYELVFSVGSMSASSTGHAHVCLTIGFFDPGKQCLICPPPAVKAILLGMLAPGREYDGTK